MGGLWGLSWRRAPIDTLEEHPNIDEILGVLSSLPNVGDAQIPRAGRRLAQHARHRPRPFPRAEPRLAAGGRGPRLLRGGRGALRRRPRRRGRLRDDRPASTTTTALKAVRDAHRRRVRQADPEPRRVPVADQAVARRSSLRPRYAEPSLGPNTAQVKALLASMPQLAMRCHDEKGRRLYDALAFTASTVDRDLRDTARDEAWRAAVLTSRRRMWAMLRRSGLEAITRRCTRCATTEATGWERQVLELCMDAACGLLVADAIDDTFTDILTIPLAMLIPSPAQAASHACSAPRRPPRRRARRALPVLTTRSGVTPAASPRAQPYGCQSSWPVAWASVSIEKMQPISTASLSSRIGGSSRSGRLLISTATLNVRHASNTISASNSLSGRPAADQLAPGAVAEDVQVRVGDGGDHPRGHVLGRHPQLGVDAADHDVEPGQQVVVLVERAVEVDVALDAGQDAERRELLVEPGHDVELVLEPLAGQAVGDGEPRRVVGEHDVLVAQRLGRPGHLLDVRAAVGPVAVRVAVALQRRAQRLAAGRRSGRPRPGSRAAR